MEQTIERIIAISESNVSENGAPLLLQGGVIGVTIQNDGDAAVYLGWNENATEGKSGIASGNHKSYGMAWPYFLDGQKLHLKFTEDGSAKLALVTIIYDKGPRKC